MGTGRCTNRALAIAGGVGLALAGLVAAWIGLRLGGPRTALWVDDASTPAGAGLACTLCVRAAMRHRARVRLFWGLLGVATGCWAVAELLWGLYPLILQRPVPPVSAADAFYLLAVPLALAALYVHPAVHAGPRHPGGGARISRSLFDGVVVATAILFVSWTLVLGPLWRTTDFSTAEGLIGLAYPFGDIVIVFFCVLAIRRMSAGGDRRPLWLLLAGLIALATSDSVYSYLTAAGIYGSLSPHLVDAGWLGAYIAIGLAAYSSDATVAPPAVSAASAGIGVSLSSLIAPLAPILIALSVTAIEIRLGHHLDTAAWVIAFALVLLVLARQGLLLAELAAPRRRLTGLGAQGRRWG